MPILGINSKRKGYRFVGVTVPPQIHNYLTLYTTAQGISKSSLYQHLIENWHMEMSVQVSEKECIQRLILRINHEWRSKKKTHSRASFNEFKTRLEKELLKKGLQPNQIATILTKIKG